MRDATVEFVRKEMRLDPRWCEDLSNGFRWWGHRLAQSVWSKPPFDMMGVTLTRLHVRTDLVTGFQGTDAQWVALAPFLRRMSLGGVIRDHHDTTRLQLAASVALEPQFEAWQKNLFAFVVAQQAVEAHQMAEPLARALNAQPAWSMHPTSGMRAKPDEIFSVRDEFMKAGQSDSRFHGRGMLEALATFRQSTFSPQGNESQIDVALPFAREGATLQLTSRQAHPDWGKGLYQKLMISRGKDAPNDAGMTRWCVEWNERELSERTRMHFLGSWCPSVSGLMHVAYYPNYLAMLIPRCAGVLAQNEVHRVWWLAARNP